MARAEGCSQGAEGNMAELVGMKYGCTVRGVCWAVGEPVRKEEETNIFMEVNLLRLYKPN